jgi:hypothetical protein
MSQFTTNQIQQDVIKKISDELSETIWDQVYYDSANPDVIRLYDQGVELTFQVVITPYMGVNHPDYKG